MATNVAPLTREQLAALPDSYFKAVDAKDVDGILAHFADDATLTVQTDHVTWTGADEIRRMFTDFTEGSVSIFHEIKNIVVEPEAGKVATEQSYIGELNDGSAQQHAQLQLLRRGARRPLHQGDHLDGRHEPAEVARR